MKGDCMDAVEKRQRRREIRGIIAENLPFITSKNTSVGRYLKAVREIKRSADELYNLDSVKASPQ